MHACVACCVQHEAQAKAAKERKVLERHAKQEHMRIRQARPKPLHEKVWGGRRAAMGCEIAVRIQAHAHTCVLQEAWVRPGMG